MAGDVKVSDKAVREAALKFIAEDVCTAPSWVKTNCLDESPSDLCPVCTARSVLASRSTESEI